MKNAYSYIRFSTPEQLKGDSLRRQLEATEAYCKENGLTLDNTSYKDLGLSAYHGTHKAKGDLQKFLLAVNEAKIPKGSTLIVENLDRLSREKVMDALSQFNEIIQAGIRLVTLQDNMIYDKESLDKNWAQLIISITYMARAHEESKTKSIRLKAANEKKRKEVHKNGKTFTHLLPFWITTDKKDNRIIIPEAAHAVKLIYHKKLEGKGKQLIEKELNEDPTVWKPPITKRNKAGDWRASLVDKLLSNDRRVLGEFQPHKIEYIENNEGNRKKTRVPDGPPVKDYFPAAISEDLFLQVQEKMKKISKLNGRGGGKTGIKVSNLFTHVAKCAICGGALHYHNKGNSPKSGKPFLYCDISRRKLKDDKGNLKCIAKPIPYQEFENLIFDKFPEIDLSKLFPAGTEHEKQIEEIRKKIRKTKKQIKEEQESFDSLFNTLKRLSARAKAKDKNFAVETYEQKLEDSADNIDSLKNQLKELNDSLTTMKKNQTTAEDQIKNILQLRSKLENITDEKEKIEIRLRLRSLLIENIEEIRVFPLLDKEKEIAYWEEKLSDIKIVRDIKSKSYFKGVMDTIIIKDQIQQIKQEGPYEEPGVQLRFDSESISKITIEFRGTGIYDKYSGELIQRRVVELRRYELTEDFRP